MSEAKLYYVSETGLVEGEALGRLRMYLSADYDALKAERDQLRAELAELRKNFAELQAELLASDTAWSDEMTRSSKLEAELAAIRASEPDVQALVLQERQRCLDIVETYQVPVGNSSAGEMAAEWTIDALREVRDDIAALAAYRKAP